MRARRHARDDDRARRHARGVTWHEAHRLWPHVVACRARHGAVFVPTDWAVRWATPPPHGPPAAWARRLRLVRGVAPYHRTLDPRTELPPPAGLPDRPPRRSPDRYRAAEIARWRAAARHRPSATGLRAPTDATALGWRAVTGRRSRALVALQHDDVDRGHGRLTRRPTTFGQSRCLPLHPTTRQALWGDGPLRARGEPLPNTPSCVVAAQGPRVPPWTVRATFVPRACQLGWRDPTDSYGPRLHDFRPRVAVQTLGRWSRDGVDGERPLPARSTALGQVQGSDPSWYLRATPPVLGLVTPRLEPAPRGPTSGPRPSPVRACWHPASPRAWYATSRPVPPPLPATATPSACCGAVPSHGCTTRLQP